MTGISKDMNMPGLKQRLVFRARRFLRDQRGSALTMFAAFLMAGVGFAAVAIDGGYLYSLKSTLQTTADAAVLVAVSELPDTDAARTAAIVMAGKNMPSGEHGAVLANADVATGNWDTATRTFTAGGTPLNAVRVVTRRAQANGNAAGLFFARILGFNQVDVETTAIAMFRSGGACVMALDPSKDGALSISGSADVTLDCGTVVSSSSPKAILQAGSSCLTASAISVTGDYQGTCLNPTPDTGMPAASDPLAGLDPSSYPPAPGGCDYPALFKVTGPTILYPGVYCGGISLSADVDFTPGMYVLDGVGLQIAGGGRVTGDEVSFYFPPTVTGVTPKKTGLNKNPQPQSVYIAGNTNIELSAPTSGDYEGVLFYQDRNSPTDLLHVMEGGADMELTGVLYSPNTGVNYAGNTEGGGSSYTGIIARTVKFTGTSYLGQDPTAASFSIDGFGAGGISLVQ